MSDKITSPIDPPLIVTTNNTITNIEITCCQYDLNSHADMLIMCYNVEAFVESKVYRLPDDVFNSWGTDDDVIKTYITDNLSTILGD